MKNCLIDNFPLLIILTSSSRSHSPSRLLSPGRTIALNGEKDWENGSTISSPASIPEYTGQSYVPKHKTLVLNPNPICWVYDIWKCCYFAGPKLYKEPSFKSNKFIIHNAITRCCLAGKVNEPQKNKIVEVSQQRGRPQLGWESLSSVFRCR